MSGATKSPAQGGHLDAFLTLLVIVPWLSGKAHRALELGSARYRALNARALQQRSTLDRALALLDLIAQFDPIPVKPSTGMGKDLTGVTFQPGLRFSDSYTRLHKADLRDAELTRATFRNVNFRKSIWTGARVFGCAFDSCSFQQAFVTPAHAHETSFEDCDFTHATVAGDFDGCAFRDCRLDGHRLRLCRFRKAEFRHCSLRGVDLAGVDLDGALFEDCNLSEADFKGAMLRNATFDRCDLRGASWSDADIGDVVVARSEIYGMSLWGTHGEVADARELSLTKPGETTALEIDGLHIAVFVVSLLDGNGVRELVDGLSSTLVLILGRFSPEHKKVLDEVRSGLRALGYTAIVFDSSAPRNRDTSETVAILAKLSRFVLADLTEPKSAPYELQQFVADGGTPLQVVTRGEPPFSMFSDLERYPWVLPAREFEDGADLLASLPELVADLERVRGDQRESRGIA